jgi:hypothetical protein
MVDVQSSSHAVAAHARIANAFRSFQTDLAAVGKRDGSPAVSGLGSIVLHDDDTAKCCAFISGSREQIMGMLAHLMVESDINPLQLLPVYAAIYADKLSAEEQEGN